jgi:SAM-dependent methyltransferase
MFDDTNTARENKLEDSFEEYLVNHSHVVKSQLKFVFREIFGYYALLYSKSAKELSDGNVVVRRSVVINDRPANSDLICQYHELPIASDSIDLVFMPAILESSEYPHQTLREVERVLIPEGQVVMLQRNPKSWLNVKRIWSTLLRTKKIPSKSFGSARMNDWFRLLGLEVTSEIPISLRYQTIMLRKTNNFSALWSKWFIERFANYHIIVAKKKVSTMIPIRPSWKKNRKLVRPRFAEPSVNNRLDHYFEQWRE